MARGRLIAIAVLVGTLVGAVVHAQLVPSRLPPETAAQAAANVSFEVISVRQNLQSRRDAGPPMTTMSPSGQFVAARETVRRLIMFSYDVRDYQIVDAPDWIGTTIFDIAAKAPDGFEPGQTRGMIRRLLADRFGLVMQKEKRALPTYSLEWIDSSHKPGPGLRPPSGCADAVAAGRPRELPCPTSSGWEDDSLFVKNGAIAALATLLTSTTGRPVIDKTGLTGQYDINVAAPGLRPGFTQSLDDVPDAAGGSIFTAVREQLGLKLTSTREPIQVLVVTRVEYPKAE